MTAPQLLHGMEARGFVVTLKGEHLSISPSSRLTPKLREVLKQRKAELLDLLATAHPYNFSIESGVERECGTPKSWRDRDATYWERVRNSASPGAQKICRVLQDYSFLLDLYRRGALPSGGCRAIITGETHDFENAAEIVGRCLCDWTKRAATCNDENRDLTAQETEDLEETKELLEWLNAANDGDRWLDLVTIADEIEQKTKNHMNVKGEG